MKTRHFLLATVMASFLVSTPALSIGFGAVLAITSTVIGVAQGVIAGKANEKAAIAQQKTFEAMFLSVQEVNTKIDGVLAELYQIAEDLEGLPVQTTTILVTNQLLGNANAVSKEVVTTAQNSLTYSAERIEDAKFTLRQLRTDLNVLIEQAKVLPSEQRRSIYSTIALAEEVYLATFLAADYLASADYLISAQSPSGDLDSCDPVLISDLQELGLPTDEITCDETVERSEAFLRDRDRKEADFNSFWTSEISETGALALDVRKYFPGSETPQIYTQSLAFQETGVHGIAAAPTLPDNIAFPNLEVTPGEGTLPIHSVRSLVADHIAKYAPEISTTKIPHTEAVCGILVPWVDIVDLSSRQGWENIDNPSLISPLAIGWAIGDFTEASNFDSFLVHEAYSSWFGANWTKNLDTLLISIQPNPTKTLRSASLTWHKDAARNGAQWPTLSINIPECSGLPVYVSYFRVGKPMHYNEVSELCSRYGVSERIIRNGWCVRDIIARDHDFNHPVQNRSDWERMRAEYFSIVRQHALEEISSGDLRHFMIRQFYSTTGSVDDGWAFPFVRGGPYFSSIVGKWSELSSRNTDTLGVEDIKAVEAMSDISAYLAAQVILHERSTRE